MNKLLPFEGKIAVITGSGRGIGRAIALRLARDGADVVVNFYRNRRPAEETAAEILAMGRKAWVVKADIGTLEGIELLFAEVERQSCPPGGSPGIDFFIHNAASGYNRPAMQQKPKGWEWTLNINARALLFASQRAVPLMEARGGGVIVSISSPGAVRVLPDYIVVGASKAALESLTRYLAVELASQNIVVNAVAPGIVLTEALQHFAAVRSDANLVAHTLAHIPAGRLVTPEDVAGLVAFLCTPAASMIRGQTITLDGGATLLGPGVER